MEERERERAGQRLLHRCFRLLLFLFLCFLLLLGGHVDGRVVQKLERERYIERKIYREKEREKDREGLRI